MLYRTRMLGDYGLERVFADLHPRRAGPAVALVIDLPTARGTGSPGAGLLLMPSVFIWPDLVATVDRRQGPPSCTRPGESPNSGSRSTRGIPMRSSLLGRTRAALLESLAEPASTHTLARRHGLAPSTVSEHLAVLHQAGLVARRRHRHAVIYQQAPLGTELAHGGGPPVIPA